MTSYYHYEEPTYIFGGRITWAVQRLILANLLIFAVQLILDIFVGESILAVIGAAAPGGIVTKFLAFDTSAPYLVWTPITYMFLHANLSHLFFNMVGLFFFGPEVERTLGTRQFFYFYLICGAIGVMGEFLASLLYGMHLVVGASGAVMGVLMAFAVIAPDRPVYLFPLPIPLTARGLVFIIMGINLLSALNVTSSRASWATHLAGMGVGYAYMKLAPKFRRIDIGPPRNPFKRRPRKKKGDLDDVGKAVDNIFDFQDRDKD